MHPALPIHSFNRERFSFFGRIARWMMWGVFIFLSLSFTCLHDSLGASPLTTTAITNTSSPSAAPYEGNPELFFGLFLGVMLTATAYLFLIWIVVRDRGQVFLMLLLACIAINMSASNDAFMALLNIQKEYVRSLVQEYSLILAYIFSLCFTYYFLEVDINARMSRPILTLLGGIMMLLLFASWTGPQIVHLMLNIVGFISLSTIIMVGLSTLRIGVSGSVSHIVAFAFFLLANLMPSLYALGYFQSQAYANHLTYICLSLSTMMFAIVIAGQFAARQEEKERALQTSNERFLLAARGSNEGLFDWNLESNEIYFSDQFRKILGASLETNGRGLREWLRRTHSEDRKILFQAIRRILDGDGTVALNFEYRINRKSDERRWIHTKAIGKKDKHSGKIYRIVGSIGDVTQKKLGEVALKASETRFRSITEAHPVPVLIIRLQDQQVLYASPGSEILLGLPSGTLISHTIDRFIPHHNERQDIISMLKEHREINMREITLSRGDGETIPVALSARHINYQNEISAVFGLYNLTEQKKAETRIAEQQEALQQSEKMAALGGLLAGVAHELNNPLSVVMGQTTLLIETAVEDKTKGRAEKIFKAADRCSRIVKSFLALARRKPPEHKSVRVNEIIQNALELLGYQFRNAQIEVSLDLHPDLPQAMGDGDQLTQVFTNLALNAAQAMNEWKGQRKLNICTRKEEDKALQIIFTDTGPGVPKELRSRVFEPFFTTKGSNGGTGVGLALCLNIIESHGGKLRLEDTPGGGATFTITLPVAEDSSETTTSPSSTENSPTVKIQTEKKLRLLLVDDEVELAQTLADLLEPEGHDIDLAANGAIALDKLRKREFDAIISDLRMPVLDGPGLYQFLKQDMPTYTKKIIYVTGDTLSPHVHTFLQETPVPVIEKPYRLVDVQKALSALLKENETHSMIGGVDSSPSEHI